MQLDSVRDLKRTLNEKLLAELPTTIRAYAAYAGASRALNLQPQQPRSVALGVSRKGQNDFLLAVRVQHRAMQDSREVELIRKKAKGEVDVRYVGEIRKRAAPWYRERNRPLRIGCSVGHYKVTAGTLGAFVRPQGADIPHILSNNHVLANENRARKGDAVLQPGAYDNGQDPKDAVAILAEVVKLKRVGANRVDAATAKVNDGVDLEAAKLTGIGGLKGMGDVFLDEGTRVAKIGRTTGLTRGRVTAFELDNVVVNYDIGALRFDDQIEIEGGDKGPFSAGGDSGSLIVGQDRRAVALLFAGSDQGGSNGQGLTYGNPLPALFAVLKIELAL